MNGKITLITPPDFFENLNSSVLLVHLSEAEQELASQWLKNCKISSDLNLYVYTNETNLPWMFYAFGRCQYKYVDLDQMNSITQVLSSYLLAHSNVYYKTSDQNLSAIFGHINSNRVNSVTDFLEKVEIG